MTSSPSDMAALYRDALEAIHDALTIPFAAIDGDDARQRGILLERRAGAVHTSARAVLAFSSECLIREEIAALRERTAQLPVTYRRHIACASDNSADCIICGPGCCSPVLGVHTSCPGTAAGAGAVIVPAVGDAVEVHFPNHGGWHSAVVRELDDVGGRYLGAWVALTGGGSHWVSPERIRPSAAAVGAR